MKSLKLLFYIALVATSCTSKHEKADAYGNFEATEIIVSSEVQGKLIDFNVDEGLELKAGDLVGHIDSLSLYYKKQQLVAQVQAAEARIFQILDQVGVLEEQLDVLNTEKERVEKLVETSSSPTKQLDDINGQIRILKRQIKATQTQRKSVSAEMKSLLYQVDQVQDQLEKSKIYNPIDGTVLEKYVETGEIILPTKPLYKIADLSTLRLRAYISEQQLTQIKIGQNVKVYVDDKKNKLRSYKGKISWISSQAEFTPKTIQTKEERVNLVYAIKIDVKNDGFLKIGMPAEVVF